MPTVSVDGGSLCYDRRGSGPPVVLIHGGWQDSTAWREQVEYFAEQYDVITYDIRGHGQSGPTETEQYSVGLFVNDLETLLVNLDIERPILAGLSVGGLIVRGFLARHPDWVRGAVVGGPFQSMTALTPPTDLNPFLSPVSGVSQMVSTIGSAATFRSLVTTMEAANGGTWLSVDADVREQAISSAGDVSTAEYTKLFRVIYEHDPADISHVETPLLVLAGERETGEIKRQGKNLAESAPKGEYRELADAAHLVNQDNPTAFNRACADFFETLADGPAD
jgi:pimeloyl-ACP methyl ester carboxylesterase